MDGQHKQRWIGVILLLLLAAMLAPLVFRSPEQVRLALDMEAPEPPAVAPVDAQPAVDEARLEQTREQIAGEREALRQPNRGEAAPGKKSSESASTREPPLSGWSVQVATFRKQANAAGLKQSLQDAGYTAYQRQDTNDNNEALYRVFVGPELERADARELKSRIALDESFELEGLVVPYHP
jgi:DedD protein